MAIEGNGYDQVFIYESTSSAAISTTAKCATTGLPAGVTMKSLQ